MSERHWYLISYDIRDPQRWRQVHKIVNGYGKRLQYSLFQCRLTPTQMEKVRHELNRELADEDDLLVIQLSPRCKIIERTETDRWDEPARFDVI